MSSPDSDIAASVSAKVTDSVTVSPMESVVTRTVTGQVRLAFCHHNPLSCVYINVSLINPNSYPNPLKGCTVISIH